MRRSLTLLALVLAGCAAPTTPDSEIEVGAQPERDDRVAATRSVLDDFDDSTPGCSVAVRHGDDIHDVQVGLADIDAGLAITPDTVFDIGSVSKQMTAGVIAALEIEGSIDLGDTVSDHLDDIAVGDLVTIDDLVHHTSGLIDYVELLDAEIDEVTDTEDALAVIEAIDELEFEPGTAFEYSNTNYVLLAQIAESATGETFVDLSDDLVFTPLSMAATRVRDDQGTLLPGQAVGYEQVDGDFEAVSSPWRQTGDGAVHSTPRDVLAWADPFIEHTDDDATVVGSAPWVELMLSAGRVADDDGTDYAFGLSTDGDLVSHAGSWLGYSSYLGIRPTERVAVALSCNVDEIDAEDLGVQILDLWS